MQKTNKIVGVIVLAMILVCLTGIVASRLLNTIEAKKLYYTIEHFYDPNDPERSYLSFYSLYEKGKYKEIIEGYPKLLELSGKLKLQQIRYIYFITLDACEKLGLKERKQKIFNNIMKSDPAYGNFLHASEIYKTNPLQAKKEIILALQYNKDGKNLDEWTGPAKQLLEAIGSEWR